MKKEKFVLILVVLLSIQLVLAQNYYIDTAIRQMSDAFTSIFAPIFGQGAYGEFLFAKILLFFLLFSIIFMALKRFDLFEHNNPALIITSLVVSIFAVRYLQPNELINAILLPYSSLGVAIATLLPLIIFTFFVHKGIGTNPFGRRAAWFVYGLVLTFMWLTRDYSQLGTANWLYIIGLGYIIISFLFDSHIHYYFEMGRFNKPRRLGIQQKIADFQDSARKARGFNDERLARYFETEAKRLMRKL